MLSEIRPVIYMEVGPTTRDSVLYAMKWIMWRFHQVVIDFNEINIGNVFFVPNAKNLTFKTSDPASIKTSENLNPYPYLQQAVNLEGCLDSVS